MPAAIRVSGHELSVRFADHLIACHFGLRSPTPSPVTQVCDRHAVNKRRVDQADRGVDEAVDLEEARGDNGVGLAGSQHTATELGHLNSTGIAAGRGCRGGS